MSRAEDIERDKASIYGGGFEQTMQTNEPIGDKKVSTLSLDAQYELAAKIQNLIMFVGLLTAEEVIGIKEIRDEVEQQISSLSAVSGIITPLEESENKIAHLKVIIKRCDAILAISESNTEMQDADTEFEASKKGRDAINKMFGLG